MSAWGTAIGQLAENYGQAGQIRDEEKLAQHGVDIDNARLQLEQQASQRSAAELKLKQLYANQPIPIGKPRSVNGKTVQTYWNTRQGKMFDHEDPGDDPIARAELALGRKTTEQEKEVILGLRKAESGAAPKSPGYDIKQDTKGRYVYLPKDPSAGTKGIPSDVIGRLAAKPNTAPASGDLIKALADRWANQGDQPPAKDRAAVEAYMDKNNMDTGYKATGASRSRADAAKAVVPVVDSIKQMLLDPEVRSQLGVLPGRVSEAERNIGNLPPKIGKLYGTLKSAYSLAGAMHGWRSIKVADEFEKAYGGLHTNPDTLSADMDAMLDTANDVYQAGYGKPISGKQGPAVGSIEQGYRFKGGDPRSKDSWEKVQ